VRRCLLILTILAVAVPFGFGQASKYVVAAYYYPWYGGSRNPHWPEGSAHRPWIGYYYSGSPAVARQQIDLAHRYGVDVFAVSWVGIDSASEQKFQGGLLKAPNLGQIRFCILYETLLRLGEGTQQVSIDFNQASVREKFLADMVYLARQYFSSPSYFRIAGRPVINFYLVRGMDGDFADALAEARQRIKAVVGRNPYFVGDLLFYGRNDLFAASQFDAVTAYSIFSTSLFQDRIDTTGKLVQVARPFYFDFLYQLRDLRVRGGNSHIVLQPGVLPQFDNRKGTESGFALLAQSRDEVRQMFLVARDVADAQGTNPKVVWITSWNEWLEGTTIEPTETGGPKYPGGNYGYDFLELVSDIFR
jgi:hypothetical protein